VNVGNGSKATGQGIVLSHIGENLALLNNGSNGHSVPATVPALKHSLQRIADEAEVSGLAQGRTDQGEAAEYLQVFVVN
jgi:hypothetical protein